LQDNTDVCDFSHFQILESGYMTLFRQTLFRHVISTEIYFDRLCGTRRLSEYDSRATDDLSRCFTDRQSAN